MSLAADSNRLDGLERGLAELQSEVRELGAQLRDRLESRLRALEREVAEQASEREQRSGASRAGPGGSDGEQESPDDAGEPRPNLPLSLVVAHSPGAAGATGSQTGSGTSTGGEVTVEARCLDRIRDVKRRAHEQLSVWYRFSSLGNLAGDGEPELPELTGCYLCAVTDGDDGRGAQQRPLRDRRRIIDCGLQNGARLVLLASSQPAAPRDADALPGQLEGAQDSSQSVVICLRGKHEDGEVDLEVRTSETVGAVKSDVHAQLGFWYRFTALAADDEDGDASPLPPLQDCSVFLARSGDGLVAARPLVESSRLGDCGIGNGDCLVLRRRESAA